MRKILTMIITTPLWLFITLGGPALADDHQVAFSWGYYASESGHTWANSDVKDRKIFDGFNVWQLEYTYWHNRFGVAINGGKNLWFQKQITPTYRYQGQLKTAEIIPQYRLFFGKKVIGRVGGGCNYSRLSNSYGSGGAGETLRGFGWLVSLGADYGMGDHWYLTLTSKYIRQDLNSSFYKNTYFRVGGLKVLVGVGYTF